MEKIFVQGKKLIDEYGRERIFNGINVCDKGRFDTALGGRSYRHEWNRDLIEPFYACGFNLIRLGVNWDALEPERGRYDETYLAFLRDVLNRCERAGIYVYLDMHQDLYSGFGDGNGDGAPAWATHCAPYRYKKAKAVWAEGYFWGKAVHRAFDNFWGNYKGVQEDYAALWQYLARELGSHPAVMGFDLMNEPFPGKSGGKAFRKLIGGLISLTLFSREIKRRELLSCLLHKEKRTQIANQYTAAHLRQVTSRADELIRRFDTEQYSPFLNRVATAIRAVCGDKILIMENCYYSNLGIPCSAPPITVDGRRDGQLLFAPHAYDLVADTPAYPQAGTERIHAIFAEHRRTQERLGVPVIVGEWGGFISGDAWHYHAEYLLKLFDSWQWSNSYWAYFDGLLETQLLHQVLTRPYPRAVTGEILHYEHDRGQNSFTLRYRQTKQYAAPTEIFAHRAIARVETAGSYEILPLGTGAGSVLQIQTSPGEHVVQVWFGCNKEM